jgi:hypothetical protein
LREKIALLSGGRLRLTALGKCLKRDLSTLSQAANRLRKCAIKDKTLWAKIERIKKELL